MKAISIVVLLILCGGLGGPCLPTTAAPLGSSTIVKTTQLELTTSIVEQYSCSPDLLVLHLRLTYRNTGTEPIILDKKSITIVGRDMASSSIRNAASKKYLAQSRTEDFGDGYGIDPYAPLDLSLFTILGPGSVLEVDGPWTTTNLVVNDGTPLARGGLVAGTYFLQVEVDPWPYFSDVKKSRINWRNSGYLWSKTLISVPMVFTIEKNRPIRKCTQGIPNTTNLLESAQWAPGLNNH